MIIGMLADAHGCAEAFDKALDILWDYGAEKVYFLGDAVGYIPCIDVLEKIIDMQLPVIRGNHEQAILDGPGLNDKDYIYQFSKIRELLNADVLEKIRYWPLQRTIAVDNILIQMVHGSPENNLYEYVYPDSDLEKFDVQGKSAVFMAHTHRPFVRWHNGVLFVNVGSCALPRDVGLLGSVCLFSTDKMKAEILRFEIKEEINASFKRCGHVHKKVIELSKRQSSDKVVGTVVRQ